MYLEHFGLQRQPFKITPDTSLFYKGNKRGAALEALKYAILSGEGIIKVVGEVGSGKTMLCRMLELQLPEYVEIVYIANPSLSPENILHVIAFELHLDINNESSRLEVMQKLQKYLLERHAQNKQVVVFVEEAQSMPVETLEEIRLLSNLETDEHKLLQMVLFGQPELDEKLRTPAIRQLKERITHSFYLDPFPSSDIYEYLNFRMRAVGYRGPDIFSAKIANNIEKKSSGLTRRINILADKALLAVYSEGGHKIDNKHIDIAARDSDFIASVNWKPASLAVGIIAIIGLSFWLGTQQAGIKQGNVETVAAVAEPTLKKEQTPVVAEIPEQIQTQNLSVMDVIDDGDLLQQRINQTERWLEQADDAAFTIQLVLMDVWARDKVNEFLADVASSADIESIYIYQAKIQGKAMYSVLYSDYASRDRAVEGLKSLPEKLRSHGAYLRTIKGIRADIRKSQQ